MGLFERDIRSNLSAAAPPLARDAHTAALPHEHHPAAQQEPGTQPQWSAQMSGDSGREHPYRPAPDRPVTRLDEPYTAYETEQSGSREAKAKDTQRNLPLTPEVTARGVVRELERALRRTDRMIRT